MMAPSAAPPLLLALLAAAALLAAPAAAQPTPQPILRPSERTLGQYTRAFQTVPAVGRYGHVAAATSTRLVLAGGAGAAAPGTALPTNYMDSNGVNVDTTLRPAATRLDLMQMPLFRTAFDVVNDNWAARDQGFLLGYGGPDFITGKQATSWLVRLQFGPGGALDAGALNWTWIDPNLPGIFDARSQAPSARIGAAAAYLPNW